MEIVGVVDQGLVDFEADAENYTEEDLARL